MKVPFSLGWELQCYWGFWRPGVTLEARDPEAPKTWENLESNVQEKREVGMPEKEIQSGKKHIWRIKDGAQELRASAGMFWTLDKKTK